MKHIAEESQVSAAKPLRLRQYEVTFGIRVRKGAESREKVQEALNSAFSRRIFEVCQKEAWKALGGYAARPTSNLDGHWHANVRVIVVVPEDSDELPLENLSKWGVELERVLSNKAHVIPVSDRNTIEVWSGPAICVRKVVRLLSPELRNRMKVAAQAYANTRQRVVHCGLVGEVWPEKKVNEVATDTVTLSAAAAKGTN